MQNKLWRWRWADLSSKGNSWNYCNEKPDFSHTAIAREVQEFEMVDSATFPADNAKLLEIISDQEKALPTPGATEQLSDACIARNPYAKDTLAHDVWNRGFRGLYFGGHKGTQAEAWHLEGEKARAEMAVTFNSRGHEVRAPKIVRAGWFLPENGEWVATSSDDPRATILYRKADGVSQDCASDVVVQAGWFLYKGVAWIATDRDNPAATMLYRVINQHPYPQGHN
jgi:hypothetical protein